jgi:hypothetical protein
VLVDASSSGVAAQFQGTGAVGDSETIRQTMGGMGNLAGQAQGTGGSVALIVQQGGTGNIAIQNQGLLSTSTNFVTATSLASMKH